MKNRKMMIAAASLLLAVAGTAFVKANHKFNPGRNYYYTVTGSSVCQTKVCTTTSGGGGCFTVAPHHIYDSKDESGNCVTIVTQSLFLPTTN